MKKFVLFIFLLLVPLASAANYTVCSSGCDYDNLTACLFAINDTNNTCIIDEQGYWAIDGSYVFRARSPISGFITTNKSGIILDCNLSLINGTYNNIAIYVKTNITITNCNISNFDTYIQCGTNECYYVNLKNCTFLHTRLEWGEVIVGLRNSSFYNNKISGQLLFSFGPYNNITHNVFENIVYFGGFPSYCEIRDNFISARQVSSGRWPSNIVIQNNTFVMLEGYPNHFTIQNSTIQNNTFDFNDTSNEICFLNSNIFGNVFANGSTWYQYAICKNNTYIDNKFYNIDMQNYENLSVFYNNTFEMSKLNINATRTNITLNFYNSSLLNLTGEQNAFWLNIFYNTSILDNAQSTAYCIDNKGNLYEESLTPMPGDCGPANFTYVKERYYNTVGLAWREQSSPRNVRYDIFLKNEWGKRYHIATTNLTNWTGPVTVPAGNYTALLVPWIEGSRINATNIESQQFEIIPVQTMQFIMKFNNSAAWVWKGEQVRASELGPVSKVYNIPFLATWLNSLYGMIFVGNVFDYFAAGIV
ncbi:MAG: hypothetical protein QXP39_01095 [Candidatus Aenigmatarchaeota archaeon]